MRTTRSDGRTAYPMGTSRIDGAMRSEALGSRVAPKRAWWQLPTTPLGVLGFPFTRAPDRCPERKPPGDLPPTAVPRLQGLDAFSTGNTEWWWSSARVRARNAETGEVRSFDIITNQQQFGGNPHAVGLVCVRDVEHQTEWKREMLGEIRGVASRTGDPYEAVQLKADDHSGVMGFVDDATYRVSLHHRDGPEAELRFTTQKKLVFGDRGWLENNPKGAFPLWASYTSRLMEVSGNLKLRDSVGHLSAWQIEEGEAHFDHQSTHSDIGTTLPQTCDLLKAGREALRLGPHWDWLRAKLADGTHLMAYKLWNHRDQARSDAEDKSFLALVSPTGKILQLDDFQLSVADLYPIRGLSIPGRATLKVRVPQNDADVAPGEYTITFSHPKRTGGWLVDYRVPGLTTVPLSEAPCEVTVERTTRGQVERLRGVGTQETADLGLLSRGLF